MTSQNQEQELETPTDDFEQSKQIFIGGEQIKTIEFRERSTPRTIGFVLLCIFTVGLYALLCFWFQRLLLIMRYKKTTPKRATKVAVIDMYGHSLVSDRICYHHEDKDVNIFTYKNLRYAYNEDGTQFTSVQFNTERPFFYFETNLAKGLRIEQISDLRELNGENSIEVPVPPLIVIVVEQALHPFIVFQIFSIIIWSIYDYYYYASLVAAMTILSVVLQTYQTRQNMVNLHEMTKVHEILRTFRRTKNAPQGEWIDVPSQDLVPGDVFEVTNGLTLTCDALLLPGSQAIMNETMLTGESVPIVKTGIPHTNLPANVELDEEGCITPKSLDAITRSMSTHDLLKVDRDKTYVLFSGTKVIRVRGSIDTNEEGVSVSQPALGVVLRVGFSTAKGQLVRSILYPKPTHFRFYTDSFKFIGVLACMALVGFIVNAVVQTMYGEELLYIFLKAGDLVTTVVPPTLPAVMAAGTSYALSRLKEKNIYCIDSQRVNMAGKLKVMCFDKTGTLTEDDLSVLGAMSTSPNYIASKNPNATTAKPATPDSQVNTSPADHQGDVTFTPLLSESTELPAIPLMQLGMTCCHSVAAVDGMNVGDPLDVKMFEFTKWNLLEKGQAGKNGDAIQEAVQQLGIHSALSGNYEALVLPPEPEQSNPSIPAKGQDIEMNEMPDTSKTALGILRRFEFSSHLQRQSVIVQRCEYGSSASSDSNKELDVFVKGSPEMVSNLCDSATIPADFESELSSFTHRGLRVIALAHRKIPIVEDAQSESSLSVTNDMTSVNALSRIDVEQNLTFLGFFILENKLRPVSKTTLGILNEAGIRSLMITGDNPLTAINIAKECGLIPSPPLYVPSSAEEQAQPSGSVKTDAQQVTPLDEYPVFLAELKDGKIFWRCFDYPQWTLNPTTLEPVLLSTMQPSEKQAVSGDTASETASVHSVSSVNTNGRAMNTNSPSPSLNSATTQSVSSAMTPNPSMTPSSNGSVAQTSNETGNESLYSFEVHSTAGSIASVPSSVVAEPEGQKKKVFNPFAGWTGGPYGPMYWNRVGLPERFYTGPKDQPPPSCYFMAVTGAAFRHMYNEEQEKLKTLEKLSQAKDKDAAAVIAHKELEEELLNSPFRKVCFLAPVFARMTPDDKANLVETLIAMGHITGMCGDGANDCGALKAAHVGISLSEVEASIAAPFTSKVASIACVVDVVLEGRGSLASSFEVFRTTAIFAMIQFISAAILIGFGSMLTDFQYLAIDILMTLPILFTIGYTKPNKDLIKKTPIDALVSFPVISSLACHIVISFVIQMCATVVIRHCYDYVPIDLEEDEDDDILQSHVTTSVYYASLISYYFSALAICLYNRYLEPLYKNWLLLAAFIFVLAFGTFNYVYRGDWWIDLMQLKLTEDFSFWRYIIIMIFAYTIAVTFLEYFVCQNNLPKIIRRAMSKKSKYEPKEKDVTVKSGTGDDQISTTVTTKHFKKPFYALIREMETFKRDVEA